MDWLMIATGFSGALTLMYVGRLLLHQVVAAPGVAVYFSPKGGCEDAIVRELRRARRSVQVLAYTFANRPIAQALVDAKLRGVNVEIIVDPSCEDDPNSDLHFFLEQGLSPLVDEDHGLAHNKVMLIDGKTVITGSFNFTHQADAENSENLIVLTGHPDVAAAFRDDITGHKGHARAPKVKAAPARKAA